MCQGIIEDLYDMVKDVQELTQQSTKTIVIDEKTGFDIQHSISAMENQLKLIKRDMFDIEQRFEHLRYYPMCDEDTMKIGFKEGFDSAVHDMINIFRTTYNLSESEPDHPALADKEIVRRFKNDYRLLLALKASSEEKTETDK